jgi:hypothetical protein
MLITLLAQAPDALGDAGQAFVPPEQRQHIENPGGRRTSL